MDSIFDDPRLVALLQEQGYRLSTRAQGWQECLLEREGERWIGRGATPESALADALAQCLPSHAARAAMRAALSGDGPARRAAPAPPADRVAEAPARDERATEHERRDPRARERRDDGEPIVTLAPHRSPEREAKEVSEAFARLSAIEEEIQTGEDDAAVLSPARQRTLLLRWVACARSVQEAVPHARQVQGRVDSIVKRLGKLSKTWWPGSVQALRREAQPSDCTGELGLGGRAALHTWREVADEAGKALERAEEADAAAGLDEFGWADEDRLEPGPADARGLLGEIAARLEEATGLLDERAPDDFGQRARAIPPAHLHRWVVLTRWLRTAVEDRRRWGALAGRLRRVVSDLPTSRRHELEQLLDPLYRPETTWAARTGRDPEARALARTRAALLREAPPAGAKVADEVLERWIVAALDCKALDSERIALALQPFEGRARELVDGEHEGFERRHRAKWRKVLAHLDEGVDEGRLAAREASEEDEDDALAAGASRPAGEPSLRERLLEEVRAETAGKRALLVTNREDPELDEALRGMFGFERLDHCTHAQRRVQSAAERVEHGGYDLVLSATGFQSHDTDRLLRAACQGTPARYVSVHRARPWACLHALAREQGLLQRR